MPLKPIDMLVNFLQMNQAVEEIQKDKKNIINQQISKNLKSKKDSEKNNEKILKNDKIEISILKKDKQKEESYLKYNKEELETDEELKEKGFDIKNKEIQKGQIIDFKE